MLNFCYLSHSLKMGRPPIPSGKRCYHCGSFATSKAGWARGKKRYKCRGCGKFFRENAELPEGKRRARNRVKRNLPSERHLRTELQSLARELGKTPTTKDIDEPSKQGRSRSLATYYAVFGSYVTAVRRSGLKQHYLQQFDEAGRERMLAELRRLRKKLKRPLIGKDVLAARKKKLVSPINHYQIAFGTAPQAIAAAGVAPKLHYTREEMISILRRLDRKLDRPIEGKDIDLLYAEGRGPSASGVSKRFGSLDRARRAAGVTRFYPSAARRLQRYWRRYTPDELVAQLKALGGRIGRKPTDRDINRASKEGRCASSETFARYFGSLRDAYVAAGFTESAPNQRRWTDKQIIAALRKLKRDLGHFPGFHDLAHASREGRSPGPGTVVRRLGKLTDLAGRN